MHHVKVSITVALCKFASKWLHCNTVMVRDTVIIGVCRDTSDILLKLGIWTDVLEHSTLFETLA